MTPPPPHRRNIEEQEGQEGQEEQEGRQGQAGDDEQAQLWCGPEGEDVWGVCGDVWGCVGMCGMCG